MVKLQDFARQLGVTDRQVQRLLHKYENEFEGLIERKGNNGTWLSDEACDLLRGKTRQQPIGIYDGRADELKEQIREQKEKLDKQDARLAELTKEIIFTHHRIDTLNQMYQKAVEDANKQKQLAEKASDEEARADREAARADQEASARADAEARARSEAERATALEAKIAALEGENAAAKRENEALRSRSLWQRIWNKGV